MGPELSQKGRRRDVDMRRRMPRSVASFWILAGLLFAALLSFAWSAQAAVIAIDYGTQWFKVSLVKPGVPLEIVLNRESKRKTRSIVALRDGKRTFDTEAVNLVGTFLSFRTENQDPEPTRRFSPGRAFSQGDL